MVAVISVLEQLKGANTYGEFTNIALDNGLVVRESGPQLFAYKHGDRSNSVESKPFCEQCGKSGSLVLNHSQLMCEGCSNAANVEQMQRLMG